MGNAPSSSRGSTPPPSPPPPPRVPPRVHSPPPRDALALMRGQSLTSMSQPTAATSLPSPVPPTPKALPQDVEPSIPKPGAPAERELLPELDVGEAMPGELEGSPQEQRTPGPDWSAARAAMERAIGSLRHRAEEIARDTMERRREQRAIEEEEARALHERKMTIYEDAEPGPLDELRFPPGLERGPSDSEVSAILHSSHSSEPTTETLVEEPEEVTEEPEAEILPEKVVEKSVIHEVQDVATIARDEPEVSKELAIHPAEVQVVGPEQSQVSGEEPAEGVSNTDKLEEAEAPQEAAPIAQETPLVTEEHPPEQAPLISSDRPPSVLEEASDTQSEHLSSSVEFPRPHTPHPTIEDPQAAAAVPFPQISEPEDQGYGTQEDEDRAAKASPRAPGKRVHWGGVEAQAACARAQDEEDHGEEHSPPFSRLLLPAPAPAEPQREARAERPTRTAVRRTVPAAVQKPMRKLEPGLYTATDVRWGMALDLSSADNRSLIAFGFHGWENQQWEFHSCGAGFIIKNVSSGLFLTLEDLVGLHQERSTEVVTGDFPMCWEMEVMDNGSEDDETADEDVYTRIRLPRTEMFLGLRGGFAGAQLFLTKDANSTSTYWRLRTPRREQVVKNPPISTTESVRNGGMTTLITTTSVTTTTTRTMTRIVTGDA